MKYFLNTTILHFWVEQTLVSADRENLLLCPMPPVKWELRRRNWLCIEGIVMESISKWVLN